MGIIKAIAKVFSQTSKNIATINRRIAYLGKHFGVHSAEYEDITNKVTGNLDISVKNGIIKIRDTAANRKQYQFISAQARNIRKTPIQVIQRKAKKRREQYRQYNDRTHDNLSYNEYTQFSNMCVDLYTECYALAETAADAGIIDVADESIKRMAVYLIQTSESRKPLFDELVDMGYKANIYKNASIDYDDIPVDEYTMNEYNLDEETGDLLTNPAFYD